MKTPPKPALKVLHAVWLPGGAAAPGRFLVWAEGAASAGHSPQAAVPLHPFAVPPAELRADVPGLKGGVPAEALLTLPGAGRRPKPSAVILEEALGLAGGSATVYAPWKVRGLALEGGDVLPWLLALDPEELRSGSVLAGDDLSWWRAAAELAWGLLAEGKYLPALSRCDGAAPRAAWEPLLDAPGAAERFRALAEAMPPACLSFCLDAKTGAAALDAEAALRSFLAGVLDAEVRAAARQAGLSARPVSLQDSWLAGLAAGNPRLDIEAREEAVLAEALSAWRGRLGAACGGGLRVCLRLEPPADAAKPWRLGYLLQALSDPSLLIEARELWSDRGALGRLAKLSSSDPEERLLAGLALAARAFAPIEASLKDSRPTHASLSAAQAHRFLSEAAAPLSGSGFGVLLPSWWRAAQAPRLGVQLQLKPKASGAQAMGMDSLLEFDWKLALGGQPLTREEFEELARLKAPLVRIRGQWVEVDQAAIRKAAETWELHKGRGLGLGEALKALGEASADQGLPVSELVAEGWVKDLLDTREAAFKTLPSPEGFRGALRPYQARGYSWLSFLKTQGFGACLADDMGLGKTVQALALLLREKELGVLTSPALLLCPTSVVGNWMKEAERFAPTLTVRVHHGPARVKTSSALKAAYGDADLVITTYALGRVDEGLLGAYAWSGVILDEAQNIKNHSAAQSRAARALKGGFRLALTGTPVENRLAELWSVMEFLNPRYLGAFEEFHRRFAVPIERFKDARAAETLRRMAQPFILRRLKTDKSIISDLPDKLEMKVFCTLTAEQATLYKAVASDMLEKIQEASGIERRGQVLAALTKLKQVLNHPAHFLKDASALPGRSGKLERLTEMLAEATAAGDSSLVFTQYAQMGELLKKHLQDVLLEETLYFHGGLSKTARDGLIERFQAGASKVMVLTLKAGGTGINLTRASRVFHYDRWWNPAVETQATDRAFRIGQTQRVQVHKFLCAGTLEEKIDQLIESKKALAETVLGTGESWLSELSNAELREVFALRDSALVDG